MAKNIKLEADGVRIAELNEMSYRQLLWGHTHITIAVGYVVIAANCCINIILEKNLN